MSWLSRIISRALICSLLGVLLPPLVSAQWHVGSLTDTTNRADYVIVTPQSYVSAIQPLAEFRSNRRSLSVSIVLLDSIAAQFPGHSPDSSIRAFVSYTLTHWQSPHPQYLLLAGNVNVIPSHSVASVFSAEFGEDSVMVDQWYVNQLSESQPIPYPLMAVGRYPAWSGDELAAMVSKTIIYEQSETGPWATRSIAVADSGGGGIFEYDAMTQQMAAVPRWKDTLTIHVNPGSLLHKSRNEFFEIWNQGCGVVNFVGNATGPLFSRASYFTSRDVDSLSSSSSLPLCLIGGGQRFDQKDTASIAVAVMQGSNRGAVCVIAPVGLMWESQNAEFADSLFGQLTKHNDMSIGAAWLHVEQQLLIDIENRRTLLGDPALLPKFRTIASADEPGVSIPLGFALLQNYPNPFNPSTTIRYGLPHRSHVTLTVYNTLGQQLATLINSDIDAGYHEIQFNANNLASGVYFYRIQAGEFTATKRLLLLK